MERNPQRNLRGSGRGKKLTKHLSWYADKKRIKYCDICGARKTEPEKCRTCDYGRPPKLLKVNWDAWLIWQDVQTQWRAGGMGLIGLDYSEVRQSAKDLGIEYTMANKRKIQALERECLKA